MKMLSVHVRNFRSVLDETLACAELTALVGANGSGKSAFLRAIDLFYTPLPRIALDDYYNRDTTAEIVVAITFGNLPAPARELFASYMQGDTLTVERVFAWDGSKAVGQGYLGRFTRFLFIPAVRDAAQDAAEGKGSVLTDLMDLVVRSVLANKAELKKLQEDTQSRFKDIMDPANLTELHTLAGSLNSTLHLFVPEASVE